MLGASQVQVLWVWGVPAVSANVGQPHGVPTGAEKADLLQSAREIAAAECRDIAGEMGQPQLVVGIRFLLAVCDSARSGQ